MEQLVSEKVSQSARIVNTLATQLEARRYLEVGVFAGDTFRSVRIAERTGVDPAFRFNISEFTNEFTRLIPSTSDAFFAEEPLFPCYDIVFIDGLHTFEQVVRDFSNVILRTHRRSVIILDDTLPNDVYSSIPDVAAAMRFRRAAGYHDTSWHGDVFKTVFYIHDFWSKSNRTSTVRLCNWLINKEKSRFEAGCGAKWRICANLPVYNSLNWLDFPLLMGLLAPQQPQISDFPGDFSELLNRTVEVGLEKISRLNYFDLQRNIDILKMVSEDEAIALCVSEVTRL